MIAKTYWLVLAFTLGLYYLTFAIPEGMTRYVLQTATIACVAFWVVYGSIGMFRRKP